MDYPQILGGLSDVYNRISDYLLLENSYFVMSLFDVINFELKSCLILHID